MNVILIFSGLIAIIVINLFSLIYGIKIGQKVANNEVIEIPKVESPLTRIKRKRKEKIDEKDNNIMLQNFANIEAYDGTSNGQKDFD